MDGEVMRDFRVIPTAALTATVIALLAFVTMHPKAAMWAVVVALVLAVFGLFTLAKESVDLRAESYDKDRHIEELETALERRDREDTPPADLADRMVEVTRAHIVEQRQPTHDAIPAADESWLAEGPLFRDGDGRWS